MSREQALQVINLVIELLTPEHKWTKDGLFDQECRITDSAFTLSCALKLMQLSVTGNYESRNLVMRKVRNKIKWHFFWRQGFHPIYAFNKHKKTTYDDVMLVLDKVKASLQS
ncbi:MAG: hypothetical protein HKN09_11785 [Saprospiraceae bacterium]|nr:hypothetical protein [Saprospiraceae bacterium]